LKNKKEYLEFWAPSWAPFWLRRYLRRLWYRHVYLKSEHWRKFSKAVKVVKRFRCEHVTRVHYAGGLRVPVRNGYIWKCPNEGTDVHHLTYENIGHETLEDVILLCRDHHKTEHGKGKK